MLKNGADVNECDEEGRSALHVACNRGSSTVAVLLLKAGIDPDTKTIDGRTPIYEAIESQRLHLVQLLLKHGIDIEYAGPKGIPPLHAVVSKGVTNLPILKALIGSGADIHVRDSLSQTALHTVSIKGSVEVANFLIESFSDIEARDHHMNTPLINAARNQNKAVMWLLIDKGADLEAMTVEGMTALNVAAVKPNAEVIHKLITSGANIETKTNTEDGEYTPLMRAVRFSQNNIVRILCKHANANAQEKRGWTALHLLAEKGKRETAEVLFEVSQDLNIESRDTYTMTPLHRVASSSNEDMVRFLIDCGANVDAASKTQYTALHYAAWRGSASITSFLLEHNANIEARSIESDGYWTPLLRAVLNDRMTVVQHLLEKGADVSAVTSYG